jgi:hypothetical protein
MRNRNRNKINRTLKDARPLGTKEDSVRNNGNGMLTATELWCPRKHHNKIILFYYLIYYDFA